MVGFTERELAESYFRAADILARRTLRRREDARELVNPLLFVYRQGVELYFKAIVQPVKRDHNLTTLLSAFRQHVRARYSEELPEWFTEPVAELAKYDPFADVFRYSESRSRRLADEGELWVDVARLRRRMALVEWAFRRALVADECGLGDLNAIVPPPRGARID
jgi:hypothetical protein